MPQEGGALDVEHTDGNLCSRPRRVGRELQDLAGQDGALKAVHVLHVQLAEVAEVVGAHQVGGSRAHGSQVQAALCNEVSILTVQGGKPAQPDR